MVDLSLVRPEHLWYAVGIITSDGNLSIDKRHINITSKDKDLLEKIKKSLLLKNRIGKKARGYEKEKKYYVLQFGDVKFYQFLEEIGLTVKKSLTLKEIKVPDKSFSDFLRGIIDGDGCITTWIHKSNGNRQWALQIASGSIIFSNWLKKSVEKLFLVKGQINSYRGQTKKNNLYTVRFGKFASKVILKKIYYTNCVCLDRKLEKVVECLKSENGLSRYGDVVSDWNLIK